MFNRIAMIIVLLLVSGLFLNPAISQVSAGDDDYIFYGSNTPETQAVEALLREYPYAFAHTVPLFNGSGDQSVFSARSSAELVENILTIQIDPSVNSMGVSSEAHASGQITTMLVLEGTSVDITDPNEGDNDVISMHQTSITYNTAHGSAYILAIKHAVRPAATSQVIVSGTSSIYGIIDDNPYSADYVEYVPYTMTEAEAMQQMALMDSVLYASELASVNGDVYMQFDGSQGYNPIVVTSLAVPLMDQAQQIGEPQIVWDEDGSWKEYNAYRFHWSEIPQNEWIVIPFTNESSSINGLVADQFVTAKFMQQMYRNVSISLTGCGDQNVQFASIGDGTFAVWVNGIYKGTVSGDYEIEITIGGVEPLLVPHNLFAGSTVQSGENDFHRDFDQNGNDQWVSSNFFQFAAQLRSETCP